jgi:hypothetical protein
MCDSLLLLIMQLLDYFWFLLKEELVLQNRNLSQNFTVHILLVINIKFEVTLLLVHTDYRTQ